MVFNYVKQPPRHPQLHLVPALLLLLLYRFTLLCPFSLFFLPVAQTMPNAEIPLNPRPPFCCPLSEPPSESTLSQTSVLFLKIDSDRGMAQHSQNNWVGLQHDGFFPLPVKLCLCSMFPQLKWACSCVLFRQLLWGCCFFCPNKLSVLIQRRLVPHSVSGRWLMSSWPKHLQAVQQRGVMSGAENSVGSLVFWLVFTSLEHLLQKHPSC